MARVSKSDLDKQAEAILKEAEKRGLQGNFFFATTFKRYLVQMQMLNDLEEAIKEHGSLVEKEYVKGRGNVYTNPAIDAYNKTSTAANGTVSTLINIVKSLSKDDDGGSKLSALLSSFGDD